MWDGYREALTIIVCFKKTSEHLDKRCHSAINETVLRSRTSVCMKTPQSLDKINFYKLFLSNELESSKFKGILPLYPNKFYFLTYMLSMLGCNLSEMFADESSGISFQIYLFFHSVIKFYLPSFLHDQWNKDSFILLLWDLFCLKKYVTFCTN